MKHARIAYLIGLIMASGLLVIVASASPLPIEHVVTLTNPGFDTDLTGWSCLLGSCTWSPDGRTTGAITITDNSSFIQSLSVPMTGAVYTITIWAKCETTTTIALIMQGQFSANPTCTQNWSSLSASGIVNATDTGIWIWFSSGGQAIIDDASLAYNDGLPEPTPTPTPTPGPSRVYFTLSSGNKAALLYQWTFGGMAITAALCLLIVLLAAKWLYEIVYQLWTWRRM